MRNAFSVLAVLLSLVSTSAVAQLASVNTVYIEQTGGGTIIDLTQTGSQNEAGNSSKALIFNGDNQRIAITQIGSLNILSMDIRGIGSNVTSNVNGSGNNINVNCGTASNTSCNDAIVEANIVNGSYNVIDTLTNAKSVTKTNITTGDHNTLTTTNSSNNLLGAKSEIINTSGDYNTITVIQSGTAGSNGFNSRVEVAGSTNTIAVTQSGTVDSHVNIKSTGDTNRITVNSGN
jgi:hypothetical protein